MSEDTKTNFIHWGKTNKKCLPGAAEGECLLTPFRGPRGLGGPGAKQV